MKAILFIAAQGSERAANAVLLAVLAYAFGLGNEADTYFVVQIIPAVMVSMIGDSFFVTTLRAFANTLDESMRWRRFGSYGTRRRGRADRSGRRTFDFGTGARQECGMG